MEKTLNSIFLFGLFTSAIFYFYLKTKQFHTASTFPIRKKMYASLAGIPLGLVLIFFAGNQFVLFDGWVTYVVGALFIAYGLFMIVVNQKKYKHYQQFIDEEAAINEAPLKK